MADPHGFLKWNRTLPDKRPRGERVKDSEEFIGLLSDEAARRQGARCMDCGVPFCMQGCPLGNRIPDWNALVSEDQWYQAWVALTSTNNFPEFTGRLCPAPCEAACVLNINDDAVTIEQIEKEIIERAFERGWVKATETKSRTGKTVVVVGSGPAGLAAAAQLNTAGHEVTVLERADKVGGLLRYGIPDFKMEKWVIDRRVALLEEEGVAFQTNVDVGVETTWEDLQASHDAVVIAIGAMKPRDLHVPGRDADGVHFAMDFLEEENRAVVSGTESSIHVGGKHAIILGGGDTGSDCLGTAHRHGVKSVVQLELLPQPSAVRGEENPWPRWPHIFRTSSSQEEGGERAFGLKTKRVVEVGGRMAGIEVVEVSLENGELVEQTETTRVIDADVLILAMGFTSPVVWARSATPAPAVDERGLIKTDDHFATSVPGVFAIGDAIRGASLIVWAISDGREAARSVDRFLMGETSLSTRGVDLPFDGS